MGEMTFVSVDKHQKYPTHFNYSDGYITTGPNSTNMDLDTARKRWSLHGTIGVIAIGAGLAVLFDASFRRHSETVQEIWWMEGLLGFVLFMTGLALFGSSVRYLVHMDRIVEYTDRKARRKKRSRKKNEAQEFPRLETDDAHVQTQARSMKTAEGF